ncbi:MAG TPA: carboxylesterase family protein [Pyrinomonadaceae bacterium]|nr:carboxylesterase family protein [Pyrinomonadaceae bacterium]
MINNFPFAAPMFLFLAVLLIGSAAAADRVKVAEGMIEGTGPQGSSDVRIFKGVPFARPPLGEWRWREPQPTAKWSGVKRTVQFGPRCMQASIFGDMNFRSNGMSEDCLYLNVWTPAKSNRERLPVLVYFYGGGFVAGDGSEPRYDGESMAAKGIVAVTVNYRLGVFGFLAHPELTKESPHHASGNYALLDQNAALRWVRQNIAAFGGDPRKVTIAGESAGSVSVSAQMASPLSKDLIAGAIGESGSILGTLGAVPLSQAEQQGVKFAAGLGATSLAALRAMTTEQIHTAATKDGFASVGRFSITIDGYFFPETPNAIFAAGRQARVPLLAGWNSEEMNWAAMLRGKEPTPENYQQAVREQFKDRADEALKAYPATTREEVIAAATNLAGDRFIGYSTWKWIDLHSKTGASPVYRYFYARPRPAMRPEMGDAVAGLAGGVIKGRQASTPPPPPARGAVHSAEIEYALGNLSSNKVYAWTPEDYKVSQVMQEYFANFIKKGDPNGPGLTQWPAANARGGGDSAAAHVMRLDVDSRVEPDQNRSRYLFLDRLTAKP